MNECVCFYDNRKKKYKIYFPFSDVMEKAAVKRCTGCNRILGHIIIPDHIPKEQRSKYIHIKAMRENYSF